MPPGRPGEHGRGTPGRSGSGSPTRSTCPRPRPTPSLRSTMNLLFCADPAEVSLLGALVLARGGGGFGYYTDVPQTESHLVDGGAPELARRMAERLGPAVHLSSPVRRIVQNTTDVQVVSDALDGTGTAGDRGHSTCAGGPDLLRTAAALGTQPSAATAGARDDHPGAHRIPRAVLETSSSCRGSRSRPSRSSPITIDQTPRSGQPGVLEQLRVRCRGRAAGAPGAQAAPGCLAGRAR